MAAAQTYEPIMTTTLASNGSLSLTSIPSTYTDLILVAAAEGSYGVSTYDQVTIRFNNDTGSNYSYTSFGANSSTTYTNRTSGNVAYLATVINSAPSFDNKVSNIIMNINNYSSTTTYKTVLIRCGYAANAAGNGTELNVGLWRSTSAINRIDMFVTSSGGTNFLAGSQFTLYGIKAA